SRLLLHFEETAAVLEQVVADRTRPQHAHDEGHRLAAVGRRQGDAYLLAEQALRADEANPGRGEITAEQREGAAVLGVDLGRLDEVEAILTAALDTRGGVLVGADELAHGLADLLLLVASAAAGRRIVVAAGAGGEGGRHRGDDILPQRLG